MVPRSYKTAGGRVALWQIVGLIVGLLAASL
jgi:hypothetical protein